MSNADPDKGPESPDPPPPGPEPPEPGAAPDTPGGKPPGGPRSAHDALAKRVFGVPEHAASEIRAILPPEAVCRLGLELDQMVPVPGSFVDERLKWRHTDLLYSVPVQGEDGFLYVLIEHQRSDDPVMPYRIYRYVDKILERYLEEHPETRHMPAVIPIVIYNGDQPWQSPVRLLDMMPLSADGKKILEPILPNCGFLLDDLTRTNEDQLRARKMTVPALLTLVLLKKAPGNPRIADYLRKRWLPELGLVVKRYGIGMFQAMMTYTGKVGEATSDALRELAALFGKETEEAYMTTFEMIRAEGRAESVLLNLENRGIPVDPHSSGRVKACTDTETLDKWMRLSLTIDKVDDLFKK